MSSSVFEPSAYLSFVQKVVDTQVWKPIPDLLDCRSNTIVQRSDELQERIETTTLSDLLSRIFRGDTQSASPSNSVCSLSSDSSSLYESLTDRDSGNISKIDSKDRDSDSASITSNGSTDSYVTVLTENDIIPNPTGHDKRYEQGRPMRSWKKVHAVYLSRRRRRFCDNSRSGSETSLTSSDEWISLQESMERQGLLRGPFEIDFVKPQYENAYIRSTRDQDEETEITPKAKKKIDLSKLIAEYDRRNTSFLKIPTDMTPKISKIQVDCCAKATPSKSSLENNIDTDNHRSTVPTVKKQPSLAKEGKNMELKIPVGEPMSKLNLGLEKFVKAKPFVPSNATGQHKAQEPKIHPDNSNVEEVMTESNLIINQWLKNGVGQQANQEIDNNVGPGQNQEGCQEFQKNLQPLKKLTATAKEFVPRIAPSDVTSSKLPDDTCPQVEPSVPPRNPPTEMKQEPRLSEIFGNGAAYNNLNANEHVKEENTNRKGTVCPVPINQTQNGNCFPEVPNNVNDPNKRCDTLGQTLTDHTQPLPRVGVQPPPGIPHPNIQLTNPHQNIPGIHPACRGNVPNSYQFPPQMEQHRIGHINPVLDDVLTGHHFQPNHYDMHLNAQANVHQEQPHFASYYMQALHQHQQQQLHQIANHHQQQQQQQQHHQQQQQQQQQHQQQNLLQQQIRNISGMQNPSVYSQQGQQLMYQMIAAGIPKVQAQQNIEQMAAHAQFQYQEQMARNMVTTQHAHQAPNTDPRHQQPSMMERFKSPSMVTEFVPRNK